jgi:hypothetical protein
MTVRLQDESPITNADVLITVEGLPGYFSEFSGIKKTFSRPMFSDGLSNLKRAAASGAGQYDPITISKAHDPEKDVAILDWIKTHECGETFNMTLRPVKRCNGVEYRGGKAWFMTGCRIQEWSTMTEIDTGNGDSVVKLTIIFSIDSAAFAGAASTSPSNL